MQNTSKEYKTEQMKGTKLNLRSVSTNGLSENCLGIYSHKKRDVKNVLSEHETLTLSGW